MFLILATYKKLIIGCLFALFIGAVFYAFHWVMRRERAIGYKEAVAEYTTKALIAEVDARRKERQWAKQLQEAQNEAAKRDEDIKELSISLAAATKRLRDTTTTIRNKLPTTSADAARLTADTAIAVFEECAGRYTEMAENADRHAIAVQTLTDAWPK